MLAPITIRHAMRPTMPSLAAAELASLFGLDENPHELVVADNLELDLRPGDVILVTGPSGSGKSSLLRAAGAQLGAVDAATIALPDGSLIEMLPGSMTERLALFSACGLAEPRLLLRTASELSDGQRARLRLALAFARHPGGALLFDEFGALLDRPLARSLAFAVQKLARRTGSTLLAATTHEDLHADFAPDVTIQCRGEGEIEVRRDDERQKKTGPRMPMNSGCRGAPSPTGRISLGGITAGMASASSSR